MSEGDERALAYALHRLVPEPAVPPQFADRIVRRYSRRQALAVGGAVVAVLAAGTAGAAAAGLLSAPRAAPNAPATADPTDQGVRAAIHRARFTRTLAFDDGALTIAPPPGAAPPVGKDRAISLFRSTGVPTQVVTDVSIGYATVTVRVPMRSGGIAGFTRVPAWVVIYRDGVRYCPRETGSGPDVPEGRRVFVLDAATGSRAIAYQEAGSWCGEPVSGPYVDVARQYVSVPWTVVQRGSTGVTVRYQAPGCADSPAAAAGSDGHGHQTLAIYVSVPLDVLPCPAPINATTQARLADPSAPLSHAPTGPVTGICTSFPPPEFKAYDGT